MTTPEPPGSFAFAVEDEVLVFVSTLILAGVFLIIFSLVFEVHALIVITTNKIPINNFLMTSICNHKVKSYLKMFFIINSQLMAVKEILILCLRTLQSR